MKQTKVGNVLNLFYSTDNGRISIEELHFDKKGVVEDKYYNKNIDRSVLITTIESYLLAREHGIKASYSALGENLLIDYNPYGLSEGAVLLVGNVKLEISQHCTLCKSLSKVDSSLPKLLKDHRGIFAKVTEAGKVKKGDEIYLLEK